ncbi:MAG: hypothetical protein ACI9KS_000845 [Sulfitobacter sp.]|jgi:hypothetical protein
MNKYIKLSCAAVISFSANTLVAQEVAVPFEETRISYQDVFLGLRNNDLAAQETASSAGDLRTSRQDVFLSTQNDDRDSDEWVLWALTGAVIIAAITPTTTTAIPMLLPP